MKLTALYHQIYCIMDIELARTFLEIVRTGSFLAAAEALHVTQTAVTARIQNLESLLGCRLLVRNRTGATLTDNGQHFVAHATQLLQTWKAAQRDLPLPQGQAQLISLGCETSLWNPLLSEWLIQIERDYPQTAVQIDVGDRERLQEKLRMGLLNAVLVHQPEYWPDIQIEQLLEEKLIMVGATQNSEPYIYIDWGDAYQKQHNAALPQLTQAQVQMNLGPLALHYLLEHGGRGYFRTRVVQRHLQNGTLTRIADTPEFSYPVFVMYRSNDNNQALANTLTSLQHAAHNLTDWG
jgi:DNA-binding transcriptional LysR family regulator